MHSTAGVRIVGERVCPSRGGGAPRTVPCATNAADLRSIGGLDYSQKRRTYRGESNLSLQGLAIDDGWLPPTLERDRGPLGDELAAREQVRRRVARAIVAVPARSLT
jgi:hypothetical protein